MGDWEQARDRLTAVLEDWEAHRAEDATELLDDHDMECLRAMLERTLNLEVGYSRRKDELDEQYREIKALRRRVKDMERMENRVSTELREQTLRAEELERALAPLIPRHCGLCVPVDEQGRMGAVTPESCVCAPHHKQARAALAAAKGGE